MTNTEKIIIGTAIAVNTVLGAVAIALNSAARSQNREATESTINQPNSSTSKMPRELPTNNKSEIVYLPYTFAAINRVKGNYAICALFDGNCYPKYVCVEGEYYPIKLGNFNKQMNFWYASFIDSKSNLYTILLQPQPKAQD